MNNHYTTLGLLPDAEDIVIKAAYKALSNAHHPDKNSSSESAMRMREINAAYEILSNPEKKRAYDLDVKSNKASISEFDRQEQYKLYDIEEAWSLALNFYPILEELLDDLNSLSWKLAFNFKIKIIEEKSFNNAEKIAAHTKDSYLKKYFGKRKEINELAESLVKARELNAAIYLNQVITTLGENISTTEIKNSIRKKFPDALENAELSDLYISSSKNSIRSAETLIKRNNGKIRQNIFNEKYTVTIGETTYKIDNPYQLCRWVTEYFKHKYALRS